MILRPPSPGTGPGDDAAMPPNFGTGDWLMMRCCGDFARACNRGEDRRTGEIPIPLCADISADAGADGGAGEASQDISVSNELRCELVQESGGVIAVFLLAPDGTWASVVPS